MELRYKDKVLGGGYAGAAQEVYSTEETRIGTWIDGKPLYQKTIVGKLPNNNDMWSLVFGAVPNAEIKMLKSIIYGLTGIIRDAPIVAPGGQVLIAYYSQAIANTAPAGLCVYSTLSSWNGSDIVSVIEYTKTTDQAIIQLDNGSLQAVASMKAPAAMPVTAVYSKGALE